MKKRVLLAVLCLSVLVGGGITAYMYLKDGERPDYSSEMFVNGGDLDGHATMYDLYTTV